MGATITRTRIPSSTCSSRSLNTPTCSSYTTRTRIPYFPPYTPYRSSFWTPRVVSPIVLHSESPTVAEVLVVTATLIGLVMLIAMMPHCHMEGPFIDVYGAHYDKVCSHWRPFT